MKNNIKRLAFSLVELMISLITISLITAAFAPVITKKLSAGTITVGSFGGSSGIIETSTAPQSQKDCNTVGAQLVYVETNSIQKTGICVTQYNIGDGNFSIPTGSIDENIEAGTAKADGYCNDKKCCWHGATSGTNCDSINGSYSGCGRTVCNWEAANSICDNLSYGGYSNWRLPTKEELEKMNPDTYSKIGSEHAGDSGLMFCDRVADHNSARCEAGVNLCLGAYYNICYPDSSWTSEKNESNAYVKFVSQGVWSENITSCKSPVSTRCVLGAITVKTVSDTACSNGSFLNDDSACVSCTIHSPKCTSCTKDFCSACADGWKVSATGGCEDPSKKSCTLFFTSAGDKQFTIPSDVDSMEVTLVSGGNGGSGGSGKITNLNFSSTNTSWSVPTDLKGKKFKLYAIGGGGGSAQNGSGEYAGSGGNGGMVNGAVGTFSTATNVGVYVGAGAAAADYSGAKGGGATYLSFYSNNSNFVAGGGGGGGGYRGKGGNGGGADTGNGGAGGYRCPCDGCNAGDGGNGKPTLSTSARYNVFGNVNYGNRGVRSGASSHYGSGGANGYLRITYITSDTGGTGGGAGAIVPMQTVDLTTNDYITSGETLKIHVGAGGAGGVGANIADDGTITTSGGAGSQGEETYISNNSNVKILATKGMQTGSTAGYITNGKNTTQITAENFSTSDGSANNGKAGGNGGTIIINSEEFTGGAGATTTANGASASTGNYGAGGGGGYSLYSGGKGADGYAKIKFMTAEANCTAAKAEIAYNDFIENRNNIFMKIKLALIQFKDFIIALFNQQINPQVKCKTCMK